MASTTLSHINGTPPIPCIGFSKGCVLVYTRTVYPVNINCILVYTRTVYPVNINCVPC